MFHFSVVLVAFQILAVLGDKKHYLSVMVRVQDESFSILEFIQHYLEEGADHIFIYDDQSVDELVSVLGCIDAQFFTIFTSSSFKGLKNNLPRNVNEKMYEMIRPQTHFLIVVDVDEFITSRSSPQLTIRDILLKNYSNCGIISVPWLLFSWGNATEIVRNNGRYSLFHRWGYHERYAVAEVHEDSAHRNRHNGAENKIIISTAHVPFLQRGYHASFERDQIPSNVFDSSSSNSTSTSSSGSSGDGSASGLVCIPHDNGLMACTKAAALKESTLQSLAAVKTKS